MRFTPHRGLAGFRPVARALHEPRATRSVKRKRHGFPWRLESSPIGTGLNRDSVTDLKRLVSAQAVLLRMENRALVCENKAIVFEN